MSIESIYEQINNKTARDYPRVSLHELIHQQAKKTPDAIAVLDQAGAQTFAELDRRSEQLANHLAANGIGHGDLVGVCCNRNVDTPSLLVGILKCGAGYVPLDPDYPEDRLAFMIENSELKHIVAHSEQLTLVENHDVTTTIVDRDWAVVESAAQRAPVPGDPVSDVAYVIYTSGSTGQPKGVVVPHGCVVNFLYSMADWLSFTESDRILATTTLSFDISVLEVFLPLVTGGSVAVVDRETAKDTISLVAAMEHFEVTLMQATPAMWRMIVEADFVGKPDMKFITGGEPLPRDLVRPLLDRCGEVWNLSLIHI